MVPGLKKVDSIVGDDVNDAVLLRETARPRAVRPILERLWFADARKRFALDGLGEIERPQRDLSVLFDPVAEIFEKLRVNDELPLTFS